MKHSHSEYNRSPAGKARSARYNKSKKGKISNSVRTSKYLEKVMADPEKLERKRELEKDRSKEYSESRKPFSDPRKMFGHEFKAKRFPVLADFQFPFEDENVVELVLQFVEWWKPDGVVLNGDVCDCYGCSDFDRDPLKTDTILDELVKSERLMKRLGKIKSVKDGYLRWNGGNHEDRWRRKIWRDARSNGGLSPVIQALMHGIGVDDMDVDDSFRKAFRIGENGFDYQPYGHFLDVAEGNLLITHGFMVSQHSGYSAKRHFDRFGKSCIISHTHRQGAYFATQMWEPKGAWETGCLCRLDPEYARFPNWQNGFALVETDGNRFHVDQIPILPGYKIHYGGRIFKL